MSTPHAHRQHTKPASPLPISLQPPWHSYPHPLATIELVPIYEQALPEKGQRPEVHAADTSKANGPTYSQRSKTHRPPVKSFDGSTFAPNLPECNTYIGKVPGRAGGTFASNPRGCTTLQPKYYLGGRGAPSGFLAVRARTTAALDNSARRSEIHLEPAPTPSHASPRPAES